MFGDPGVTSSPTSSSSSSSSPTSSSPILISASIHFANISPVPQIFSTPLSTPTPYTLLGKSIISQDLSFLRTLTVGFSRRYSSPFSSKTSLKSSEISSSLSSSINFLSMLNKIPLGPFLSISLPLDMSNTLTSPSSPFTLNSTSAKYPEPLTPSPCGITIITILVLSLTGLSQ